jgi:hypothetical protein
MTAHSLQTLPKVNRLWSGSNIENSFCPQGLISRGTIGMNGNAVVQEVVIDVFNILHLNVNSWVIFDSISLNSKMNFNAVFLYQIPSKSALPHSKIGWCRNSVLIVFVTWVTLGWCESMMVWVLILIIRTFINWWLILLGLSQY